MVLKMPLDLLYFADSVKTLLFSLSIAVTFPLRRIILVSFSTVIVLALISNSSTESKLLLKNKKNIIMKKINLFFIYLENPD